MLSITEPSLVIEIWIRGCLAGNRRHTMFSRLNQLPLISSPRGLNDIFASYFLSLCFFLFNGTDTLSMKLIFRKKMWMWKNFFNFPFSFLFPQVMTSYCPHYSHDFKFQTTFSALLMCTNAFVFCILFLQSIYFHPTRNIYLTPEVILIIIITYKVQKNIKKKETSLIHCTITQNKPLFF